MKGNYNSIAPFYDFLSKAVFGTAIVNAQRFLIQMIPPKSIVLIVGGGTGWILEEICKVHQEGLQIVYVEPSEKMIAISRKRNAAGNKVSFINDAIPEAALNGSFDAVITPFLFDNFSGQTAQRVFDKIDRLLAPEGLWLFTDFQLVRKSVLWQLIMLKIMYLFFRIVCRIEAHHLPDTDALFHQHEYRLKSSQTFFKNFICSSAYRKSTATHAS
jgi:ubiquinone/menaquinone biosynthesis C-methylase UbiE